mmetsp:Transcript_34466/g.75361  ORF Transcript_34466/g.75361 Transcript_34466/m.75361 type:complete len:221 (-) Transcript_34466:590-1252(-)
MLLAGGHAVRAPVHAGRALRHAEGVPAGARGAGAPRAALGAPARRAHPCQRGRRGARLLPRLLLPQAVPPGPAERHEHGGGGVLLLHGGRPPAQLLQGGRLPAPGGDPAGPGGPGGAGVHPRRRHLGLAHGQGVRGQRGRAVPHGGQLLPQDAGGAGAVCGVDAPQPVGDAPAAQAAAAVHQARPRLQRHGAREPGRQRGAHRAPLLHPRPGPESGGAGV